MLSLPARVRPAPLPHACSGRGAMTSACSPGPSTPPARSNSLPPSTQKLLAQVDLLDLVERVGYRTTGNTVWWGGREGQVQPFGADGSAWGYQIDRAVL